MVSRFPQAGRGKAVLREFAEGKVEVLWERTGSSRRRRDPESARLVIVDEEQRSAYSRRSPARPGVSSRRARALGDADRRARCTCRSRGFATSRSSRPRRRTPPDPPRRSGSTTRSSSSWRSSAMHARRAVLLFHNRVETIEEPQARPLPAQFLIAHGTMAERRLEEQMHAFLPAMRRPRLDHDHRVGIDIHRRTRWSSSGPTRSGSPSCTRSGRVGAPTQEPRPTSSTHATAS